MALGSTTAAATRPAVRSKRSAGVPALFITPGFFATWGLGATPRRRSQMFRLHQELHGPGFDAHRDDSAHQAYLIIDVQVRATLQRDPPAVVCCKGGPVGGGGAVLQILRELVTLFFARDDDS